MRLNIGHVAQFYDPLVQNETTPIIQEIKIHLKYPSASKHILNHDKAKQHSQSLKKEKKKL